MNREPAILIVRRIGTILDENKAASSLSPGKLPDSIQIGSIAEERTCGQTDDRRAGGGVL